MANAGACEVERGEDLVGWSGGGSLGEGLEVRDPSHRNVERIRRVRRPERLRNARSITVAKRIVGLEEKSVVGLSLIDWTKIVRGIGLPVSECLCG